MHRLWFWIEREAPLWQLPIYTLVFLAAAFWYSFLVFWILGEFGIYPERKPSFSSITSVVHFPLVMIVANALWEEIVFRFVPLALAIEVLRGWDRKVILVLFVVASSILFGWAHGSFWFISVQGVFGFFWCILFLKFGGLRCYYPKAIFATTFIHASWNIFLKLLIHYFG